MPLSTINSNSFSITANTTLGGASASLSRLTVLNTTSSNVSAAAGSRGPIASFRGGNDNNRFDIQVENTGPRCNVSLSAWNAASATSQIIFNGGPAGAPEVMRMDINGYITTPLQPAFMVGFTSTGNVSLGDGVLIPFNDKTSGQCFDVSGSFNTTTSRFTAPVTGVYLFMVTVSSATSGGYSVAMRKNGSSIGTSGDSFAGFMYNAAGSTQDMITSLQVQLTSGDYIEVFTRNGAYSVYRNHSWFLGRLLG